MVSLEDYALEVASMNTWRKSRYYIWSIWSRYYITLLIWRV